MQNPSRFSFTHGLIAGVLLIGLVIFLLPSYFFAYPKHLSKQSACVSNMKQLGTGQMIYCADNSDNIPPYYSFDGPAAQDHFTSAVQPYCKNPSIYLCTESPTWKSDRSNTKMHLDQQHYPLILKQKAESGLINTSKILDPAKTAWMHDPIMKVTKTTSGEDVETYHKKIPNSVIVLFFDSHVMATPTFKGMGRDPMDSAGTWIK